MRQLRKPTPLVLDTQMAALTESFTIEASDTLEQWWDASKSVVSGGNPYMPDRSVTPLVLTPRISVYDIDTQTTYTPSFYSVNWYRNNSDVAGRTDYTIQQNGNLVVRENVSAGDAVTIRCEVEYIDPRDVSTTHHTTKVITLATNKDATKAKQMTHTDFLGVAAQGHYSSTGSKRPSAWQAFHMPSVMTSSVTMSASALTSSHALPMATLYHPSTNMLTSFMASPKTMTSE